MLFPVMEPQQTFIDRAAPMVERGVPVVRLLSRRKEAMDKGWQNLATTDIDQLAAWNQETPDANCGSVAKSEGFCFFESDEKGVVARYTQETGEPLQTFTVQSQPGRYHFYFRQNRVK